ncbi:MAG: autotransporter-associated beta strand repeat-containing protein, partial [Verrucomicrobia bacterium]|nr:autotransporter-associated beta strand repeat-containing protein [Verrucomicrobiota bacterium]
MDNGNGNGKAPVTRGTLANNTALMFTASTSTASDFRGNITGTGTMTVGPGNVRFGPWGSVVQITLAGDVVVTSSGTLQVAGRSNYQMFNTPGNLVVSNGALVTWNALNDLSPGTASTFGALIGEGVLSGDYSTPYAAFGNGNASGTFSGVIQNALSITKIGSGTQILTGANTYTGTTTVSNGTLQVDGSLGGSGAVTVAGGTLRGTGSIAGPIAVNAGGTLAPADASALGTLSASSSLAFNSGGTNLMRISKTGATLASDKVQGLTSVTYGGTLTLTATGDAIANGDTFVLFPNAGSYQGAFAAYNLPPLATGLSWDPSQLTTNGSISVGNAISPLTFSPAAGGYIGAQTVTITCLTAGATIYYTTNGTTPTTGSPSGASGVTVTVPVNTTRTIKAFARAPGYADSLVVSATYTTEAEATWTNQNGGSWPDPNNWALNIPANGSDATANFSTLTLPGDTFVSLDSSPTVGSLVFGDKGNLYNWEIDAGSGGTLTLDATNPPTFTVVNKTATINTALAVAGTNALIKTGNGTLALAGTGIHYTSPTLVNAGTLVFMDNGKQDGNAPVTSVILTNNSALVFTASADLSDFRGNITGTGTLTVNGPGSVRFGPWGSVVRVTLTGDVMVASSSTLQVAGRSDYQMFNTPGNLVVSNGATVSWTALNDASPNTASTFGALIGEGLLDAGYGTPHVRFGNGNASGTFSGVIQNSAAGSVLSITKIGSGTQILSGANTYDGTTTVSNGTLQVDGSLGTNAVTVAGGTLGGTGTINGPVIINSGGTLSAGGASIGTLTLADTLTLNAGSTTMLKLNKATTANDSVAGISTLTYGGTLTVTNLAGTLVQGDTFQLFKATTYDGNFAAMSLPALGAGLVWNWTPANGTLTVVKGETPPVLSGFGPLTGSSFPLTFSGPSGQTYKVLASTNVALPIASWMQLASGTFGATAITYTDTTATNNARFYRIVSP